MGFCRASEKVAPEMLYTRVLPHLNARPISANLGDDPDWQPVPHAGDRNANDGAWSMG